MWGIFVSPRRDGLCGVHYTSKDGLKWEYRQNIDLMPFPREHTILWHIDVQKLQGKKQYIALVVYSSGFGGMAPCNLFWAKSDNGINWSMNATPVLFLNKREVYNSIYRSSFMLKDGKLKLWYSAEKNMQWNIYYKEVKTDYVGKEDLTSNVIL